jgi:hypothetical protein
MKNIKFLLLVIALLSPIMSLALEPIFKLKGNTILLSKDITTIGVVYNGEAVSQHIYSNKMLATTDFAGKTITVTNANVINWQKKNQGVILEFTYNGENYCFYFPQNVHTSDFSKKRAFTKFYTGSYRDSYQNQDDSHFVLPENILIRYWLPSDIKDCNDHVGTKFKMGNTTYIFLGIDINKNEISYRVYNDSEIKPYNSITRKISPYDTISNSESEYSIRNFINSLVWIE